MFVGYLQRDGAGVKIVLLEELYHQSDHAIEHLESIARLLHPRLDSIQANVLSCCHLEIHSNRIESDRIESGAIRRRASNQANESIVGLHPQ